MWRDSIHLSVFLFLIIQSPSLAICYPFCSYVFHALSAFALVDSKATQEEPCFLALENHKEESVPTLSLSLPFFFSSVL